MEKYNLSKFNHYVQLDNVDDNVIIFNTLTNLSGIISKEILDNIKKKDDITEKEAISNWIDRGFLVPEYINEDILGAKILRDKLNPTTLDLTILASENCNFRCPYCFDQFNGKNISRETIDNIVEYLKRNLRNYTGLNIGWFGGEPLLAKKEIFELSEKMLSICRTLSRSYEAVITTNGYLLDIETFKNLLKYKVFTYIITLDGLEENHNKNRPMKNGGATYGKIIDNLRQIYKYTKYQRFKIQIRTNVTKLMYDDFLEYISFLYNEFGENPNFSFIFSPVYDWGGDGVKDMSGDLITSLNKFYDILKNNDISLNLDDLYYSLTERLCKYGSRNNYTIRPNGEILICPQMNKSNIGKLTKGKMILDSYAEAEFRELNACNIKSCKNCQDYVLCEGRVCPKNLKAIPDNIDLNQIKIPCSREFSEIDNVIKTVYSKNKSLFVRL